jgi:hypothetical protein
MITAKQLPGFLPFRRARRLPFLWLSPTATTCGTVKLTVPTVVIPAATHSSRTSSPCLVTGNFTAMLGAQELKQQPSQAFARHPPPAQIDLRTQSRAAVRLPVHRRQEISNTRMRDCGSSSVFRHALMDQEVGSACGAW